MAFNLSNHPITLKGLYLLAMARGFMRYRNPYRRRAWRSRVEFYERAWREAARELGADCRELGNGILEITLDDFRTIVSDNYSAIDHPVTIELLSDKAATYRILAQAELPTPRHVEFTLSSFDRASAFLKKMQDERPGAGCVIKPVRGTGGGRGITAGVRTAMQAARAAAAAAIYCKDLLIEEQIAGDNYRLLYLDGELIDAFVRQAPSVIGDGRSTVGQLVAAANAERLAHGSDQSQVLLTIDLDMRRTLAEQELSLTAIAAAGRRVILKTVVNENRGDENVTAVGQLCPQIVEEGERAVRALGVRLGGVDIITTDPSRSLRDSGGVMLEVNAPPNFYYHYHKKDGVFPVAEHVLRRLMEDSGPGALAQAAKPQAAEVLGV